VQVSEGERPIEDYSRDELLALVRWLGRPFRPRGVDGVSVWHAVDKLRPLAGEIPMLQVVIDYLDPPLDEVDGVRGWWRYCQLCEKIFFHADGDSLCVDCKPNTAVFHCYTGWSQAGFSSHTPRELTVFVRRDDGAVRMAEAFRDLARYADAAAAPR
jgi:hypothetical protein